MESALALARRGFGRTSPNPAVGAVIVKDGRVVGEGFTRPAGGPHAEVVALAAAGPAAAGATMYVTLEPCCHFGRTPPCTRAIISAGVHAVEIAVLDPNPMVHGQGCAELAAAGLRVNVGQRQDEAVRLNEAFVKYITHGLPFVTAKWAMTLDGKIATREGHSRWVTSEAARHWVHQLRDVSDAILVGANTVIVDDPQLTARLPVTSNEPRNRPLLRVVVDTRGRLPVTAQVLSPAPDACTLIATTAASCARWRDAVRARGADVLTLPESGGKVDLRMLLAELGRREITSVLVEGGAVLMGALIEDGLVDKVHAFIAPKIVGGSKAPSPVAGNGCAKMDEAILLSDFHVERLGDDLLLSGYPRRDGSCRPLRLEGREATCLQES